MTSTAFFSAASSLATVFAARLGHVWLAPAFPSDDKRRLLDDFSGVEAVRQILCHPRGQGGFAIGVGGQNDDSRFELPFERVHQLPQGLGVGFTHPGDDRAGAADVPGLRQQVPGLLARHPPPERLKLSFQLLLFLQEPPDLLGRLKRRGLEDLAHTGQLVFFIPDKGEGPGPRDGLDPSDARGHAAFVHNLEQADLPGGRGVRSPAKLLADGLHGHQPDDVPVFLAEQRHRPLRDGVLDGHLIPPDRGVGPDVGVDDLLDALALSRRQGREVGVVEPEPVGGDERTGLLHVVPQNLAQRGVQEVGGGVVELGVAPPPGVDPGLDLIPDAQGSAPDNAGEQALPGDGGPAVLDVETQALALQEAAVSDLSAGFRIKGRPVQEDLDAIFLLRGFGAIAVL